jgi:hypothetical protein
MYKISIRRKGASKWIQCSTDLDSLLSVCQIFESTDDVAEYMVGEVGKFFQITDRYTGNTEGFKKWKPIPKDTNG